MKPRILIILYIFKKARILKIFFTPLPWQVFILVFILSFYLSALLQLCHPPYVKFVDKEALLKRDFISYLDDGIFHQKAKKCHESI